MTPKKDDGLFEEMEKDESEEDWGEDDDDDDDDKVKYDNMDTRRFRLMMSEYFGQTTYYLPGSAPAAPNYTKIIRALENVRLNDAIIAEGTVRSEFAHWKKKNAEVYDDLCNEVLHRVPDNPRPNAAPGGGGMGGGGMFSVPERRGMSPAEEAVMLKREMFQFAKDNLPPADVAEMIRESLREATGSKPKETREDKLFDTVLGFLVDKAKSSGDIDQAEERLLTRMEKYKNLFGGSGNSFHDDPNVAMGQVISGAIHENVEEITNTVREAGGMPRKKHRATMTEADEHVTRAKQELESIGRYYGACPDCGAVMPNSAPECWKCGKVVQPDPNAPAPPFIGRRREPPTPRYVPGQAPPPTVNPPPQGQQAPPPPPPSASPQTTSNPPPAPEPKSPSADDVGMAPCEACGVPIPTDATECPECGEVFSDATDEYLERALNPQNGLLSVRLKNKISWGHDPRRSATGIWYNMDMEEQKGTFYVAAKGLDYVYGLLTPIAENRPDILEDFECPDLLDFYRSDKAQIWLTAFFDTIKKMAADKNESPYGVITLTPDEMARFDGEVQAVVDDLVGTDEEPPVPAPEPPKEADKEPPKGPAPEEKPAAPPEQPEKTPETPVKQQPPAPKKEAPAEGGRGGRGGGMGGPPGEEPLIPPPDLPADFVFCTGCGNSYPLGDSWEAHQGSCKKLNRLKVDGKIEPYDDMAVLAKQLAPGA